MEEAGINSISAFLVRSISGKKLKKRVVIKKMRREHFCFKNRIELIFSKNLTEAGLSEEDCEVIKYGLWKCIMILLNFLTVVLSGMVWTKVVFSILLYIWIFVLRPYTGGFHADTKIRCYLISLFLVNLTIISDIILNIPLRLMLVVFIAFGWVIWKYSPIEVPLKPLDCVEKQRYSCQAKKIISAYGTVFVVSILLKVTVIYESLFWSTAIIAFLILFGKWKYGRRFCINDKGKH